MGKFSMTNIANQLRQVQKRSREDVGESSQGGAHKRKKQKTSNKPDKKKRAAPVETDIILIIGRVKTPELRTNVAKIASENQCKMCKELEDASGKSRNMMKLTFSDENAAEKTAAEIKETCKGVSVKTIKPDSSEKNSGKTEKYSIAILENIKESQFEDVKKIIEETCGIAEFTPLTDNRTKTFRSAVRLQCEDLDKTDDVITAINTAKLGKIRAVKRMKTAGEERGPEKPDEKKQDKERYFIGNLPRIPDAQQLFTSELREICGAKLASFKLLKNEMNLPNGCAIVTFAKKKQEAAAVRSIQDGKIIVSGRTVRVEQKQTADQLSKNTLLGDKNTVFVANLPLTLTEDQIIFALKKFGEIETVNMNFGDSGFNGTARVTYTHLDSVTKAVQHSGVFLINRRPIRIDLDKKKAARSAQLDLNSTLSTAKTILVSPVTNGMQLQAVAVKKLFSDLGKVKYSRKSLPEDTPGEEIPDGSITLCFTSSACVAIAMQMVGHEVECEGDKPPPKSGIVIKVIGLESGKQQARPKEISFTFNGARHWCVLLGSGG